jgi:hypothetical protein
MSKYEALTAHLQSARTSEVPMTFAEIESVVGFRLPASARSYPAWWSNHHGTNPAVESWRAAGFRTARVSLGGERLVFIRETRRSATLPSASGALAATTVNAPTSPRGVEEASDVILLHRSDLAPAAIRLLDDLVEAGGSKPGEAAAALINAAAIDRRRKLLEEFAALSPKVEGSSVDLIREDRDER